MVANECWRPYVLVAEPPLGEYRNPKYHQMHPGERSVRDFFEKLSPVLEVQFFTFDSGWTAIFITFRLPEASSVFDGMERQLRQGGISFGKNGSLPYRLLKLDTNRLKQYSPPCKFSTLRKRARTSDHRRLHKAPKPSFASPPSDEDENDDDDDGDSVAGDSTGSNEHEPLSFQLPRTKKRKRGRGRRMEQTTPGPQLSEPDLSPPMKRSKSAHWDPVINSIGSGYSLTPSIPSWGASVPKEPLSPYQVPPLDTNASLSETQSSDSPPNAPPPVQLLSPITRPDFATVASVSARPILTGPQDDSQTSRRLIVLAELKSRLHETESSFNRSLQESPPTEGQTIMTRSNLDSFRNTLDRIEKQIDVLPPSSSLSTLTAALVPTETGILAIELSMKQYRAFAEREGMRPLEKKLEELTNESLTMSEVLGREEHALRYAEVELKHVSSELESMKVNAVFDGSRQVMDIDLMTMSDVDRESLRLSVLKEVGDLTASLAVLDTTRAAEMVDYVRLLQECDQRRTITEPSTVTLTPAMKDALTALDRISQSIVQRLSSKSSPTPSSPLFDFEPHSIHKQPDILLDS